MSSGYQPIVKGKRSVQDTNPKSRGKDEFRIPTHSQGKRLVKDTNPKSRGKGEFRILQGIVKGDWCLQDTNP
jgi:hypothetical protein